ncbi:peptidase M14 [Kordiimonadales bacterium JCM 17843]|nr:peptidase M14 [Kordiimonadales bacterium JCM 17843]
MVTNPENQSRLEDIRTRHVALSNPDSGTQPNDSMPVVTWLNYGVHGAESSGMDAVIPVVYHLAAAKGDAIENTLSQSVILITAIFNPDGHSRRINHVLKFMSDVPVTDPAHAAHDLWIDARTNHYWFDLNRQWLLQTQPEAQAWLSKWHQWKPNVTVDYHEMGSNSTYYFHPGVPNRKNPLIPDRSRQLLKDMAHFHAKTLDRDGTLYFTEEGFDNYYIGKGSTYPHINGSVGILFEAGAARGGAIETPNGVRHYAANIRKHFRTSLSSIEGARSLAPQLLDNQYSFFQEAKEQGQKDDIRGWVFTSPDKARLAHFLDLLERHQVQAYALARDVTVDDHSFQAGDAYLVPVAQAQYHMIKGLFDRVRSFKEAIFYDVSGWTLPLAYDLDYAALNKKAWRADLSGDEAQAHMAWPRAEAPDRASYGYVFSWEDYYAPKALNRLLAAGVHVRGAMEPFSVLTSKGERHFSRGALFVPLAGQDDVDADSLYEHVTSVTQIEGIPVHAVTSGLTPTQGADLGGRSSFQSLNTPHVVLVFDDGLSKYEAGEAWHLLDKRMQIPVTLRAKSDLMGLDWSRYSHMVLPGGRAALNSRSTKRLEQWIKEEGGTLIALRQGAAWAQQALLNSGGNAKGKDKAQAPKTSQRTDYADYDVEEAKDVIGGAIFASDLDITHPLGFGYQDRLIPSHRNTTLVLATPQNPYATIARYLETSPILSGYASDKRLAEIAGSPMMVAERLGRGTVILFADDPNFRATFLGTNKLFLNGLFWSKAFRAPRSIGDEEENALAH